MGLEEGNGIDRSLSTNSIGGRKLVGYDRGVDICFSNVSMVWNANAVCGGILHFGTIQEGVICRQELLFAGHAEDDSSA